MEYKVKKPIPDEWDNFKNYPDTKFLAEAKLDGMRALLTKQDGKAILVRENGNIKNNQYPELVQVGESIPDQTIIDGEVCILESPMSANFFKLLQRETTNTFRTGLLIKAIPATFVAFDLLMVAGKDMKAEPLYRRRQELQRIVDQVNHEKLIVSLGYCPSDLILLNDPTRMEGIILKEHESLYDKKSTWIKFKNYKEDDFKVTGFTSEKRMISALQLADNQGNNMGKVNYTGYPQTTEWKNKVVGMTAVVKYMETNLGKVRFPILKELRDGC